MKGLAVYLSGPMTGWKDFNKAAFDAAEGRMVELGAGGVFNPADTLPRHGRGWSREQFMLYDLGALMTTIHSGDALQPFFGALVLLPWWWTSRGSRLERRAAMAAGIPVVRLRECE